MCPVEQTHMHHALRCIPQLGIMSEFEHISRECVKFLRYSCEYEPVSVKWLAGAVGYSVDRIVAAANSPAGRRRDGQYFLQWNLGGVDSTTDDTVTCIPRSRRPPNRFRPPVRPPTTTTTSTRTYTTTRRGASSSRRPAGGVGKTIDTKVRLRGNFGGVVKTVDAKVQQPAQHQREGAAASSFRGTFSSLRAAGGVVETIDTKGQQPAQHKIAAGSLRSSGGRRQEAPTARTMRGRWPAAGGTKSEAPDASSRGRRQEAPKAAPILESAASRPTSIKRPAREAFGDRDVGGHGRPICVLRRSKWASDDPNVMAP